MDSVVYWVRTSKPTVIEWSISDDSEYIGPPLYEDYPTIGYLGPFFTIADTYAVRVTWMRSVHYSRCNDRNVSTTLVIAFVPAVGGA